MKASLSKTGLSRSELDAYCQSHDPVRCLHRSLREDHSLVVDRSTLEFTTAIDESIRTFSAKDSSACIV